MPSSGSEQIIIPVADGTKMGAYVARPSGRGPHPALVLFQEALGVNAQLRGVADRWAAEGFVVVAPELFHRFAPGYERERIDMAELMPMVQQLTIAGMEADAAAAFHWLGDRDEVDASRICALGFCMGGRATWLANAALPLAAAVSFYAGGLVPALLDRAPRLHGPHLFFWGGQDQGIPAEHRRAVADALHDADRRHVDVVFSQAAHAFFNEREPTRFDPEAARQSWALACAFLHDAVRTTT